MRFSHTLAALGLAALSTAVQAQAPMQTCTPTQARATERYWFAGNRIAIDFGTSGNTYTVSANASTAASVPEGSTVVTDSNGTLQFWVGGGTVHNRNQVAMANGTGLSGNLSAVQTVAAFAAPGVPGKYFVVATTGAAANTPGALYYSHVDMTANGGLGTVVSKNTLVPGSTGLASEALTAVPTSDGLGHWVLTASYSTNNVVAMRFDDSGPVGTPVATALSGPVRSHYGSIYFSPDLTRFVYVTGGLGTSYAYLMSFNAATGAATELASWRVPTGGTADPNMGSGNRIGYAADFSPSGDHVYVSQIYPGRLWRYDVTTETSAAIAASQAFVGATGAGGNGGGHVRRGPDGAMWVANIDTTNTLTRIPAPDAPLIGDVGFVRGNVALPTGAASVWGLPQLVAGCPRAYEPDAVPTLPAPATVLINQPHSVTVNARNDGTLGDVTDGSLSITLPAGVRLQGAAPASCTVAPVAVTAPQVLVCDLASLGPIAPSAAVPVSFQVTVTSPGSYSLSAAVSSVTGEVNTTNNTASTTLTAVVEPDAMPSISGPASVTVGTTQVLAVQIANVGTQGDVQDGTASISLPPGVRLSGAAPAGCTANAPAATDPQVITCDLSSAGLGPIAPGANVQVNLPVTASDVGSFQIDVSVAAVTDEVVTTNNTASMTLQATAAQPVATVQPVPGLSLTGLGVLGALLAGLGWRRRRSS